MCAETAYDSSTTRAIAVISPDDAMRRLSQLMRAALEDATTATAHGKSALRALRQATRCAGPLLRLTETLPDARPNVMRMILLIDRFAEDAMRAALDRQQDVTAYRGVQITCYLQLARLAIRQAKGAGKTQSPRMQPVAAQAKRAADMMEIAPSSNSPAQKAAARPITQRAQWLATQRRKGKVS